MSWWQREQDVPLPALQWLIPCGRRAGSRPIFSLTSTKEGFWLFQHLIQTYLNQWKCENLQITRWVVKTIRPEPHDTQCLWFILRICFAFSPAPVQSCQQVVTFFHAADILFCMKPPVYVGHSKDRPTERNLHHHSSVFLQQNNIYLHQTSLFGPTTAALSLTFNFPTEVIDSRQKQETSSSKKLLFIFRFQASVVWSCQLCMQMCVVVPAKHGAFGSLLLTTVEFSDSLSSFLCFPCAQKLIIKQ